MTARAALLTIAALLLAAPAAAANGPDPCAQFQAPLAYNACLAAHGPRAAPTRPESPGEATSGHARHVAHGRQRLEFSVGD